MHVGTPPLDHRRRAAGAAVLLALAVTLPLARSLWVVLGPGVSLQQSFEDDTYYYAVIAQNLAHGRGSTFGGLVPTNGYQPLWQLLLVPLAALADGDAFLRLLVGLDAVLFALSVVLMWSVARRLGAGSAGCYATVYAVTVGLLVGNQFFNGMEIALVLPAVLAFVGTVLASRPGTRTGIVLGVLALVVALSRLDAVAVPVLFGVLTLLRRDPGVRRTTLVAGAVLVAGLGACAAASLLAFGTPVPVSGQAKAVGGGTLGAHIAVEYLTYGSIGPVPVFLGVQAVLVTLAALVLLRRTTVFTTASDPLVRDLLVACLLAQGAQIAYYTLTSSFEFWPWYYHLVPVQLFLGGLVVAQVALRTRRGRPWTAVPAVAAVAGAALLLNVGAFVREPPETGSWTAAAPRVAAWVREHSAPSDVVAVGDRAGYVTWLARRPTVQLEGLVEDVAYLDVLRERRIAAHMAQVGVRYYVRSEETDGGVPPEPAGCTTLVEPLQGAGPKSAVPVCPEDLVHREVGDDFVWSVWRYRP